MKLFLGVDGGQSSTVALIADETGRVLGAGIGGACNHAARGEGRAKFSRALAEALGSAGLAAGLLSSQFRFEAACLGFSGGFEDKDGYAREFIDSRLYKLTHDAEIALTGATGGEPGVIVIAGTGSIAFGKNAAGETGRAGGWGFLFGDEGGAFYLVNQALRSILAMEEGWGAKTQMRQQLLNATKAFSAHTLMHDWYNDFDRTKIAQLAPLVDRAAEAGDIEAVAILNRAGLELAVLVSHVYKRLFEAGEQVAVSFIGGVFESKILTAEVSRQVEQRTGSQMLPPRWPPAAGALLEALKLTGNQSALRDVPRVKS